jgi:uncharacterized protein
MTGEQMNKLADFFAWVSVILAAMVLGAVFAMPAHAAVPNPPPLNNHPVVDAANIIPDADEVALNTKLLDIQKRSKHQVAVLTVPDLGGYDIDEYSLNAARFYALGSLDGDDGVLITVAPNEHKTRIEVGRGLVGMLTDMQSGMIVDNEMIPRFKEKDWVGGINAGVDGVATVITPLTPAQLLVKKREESERASRHAQSVAAFKDFMGYVLAIAGLGGIGFGGYRMVTAPARRRKREEEEAEAARQAEERQRVYAERMAERAKADREAALRAAAKQAKFDKWYAALSPHEKAAYDAEEQRKRDAAEAERQAEAERARKRREREDAESSSYSSSYSSGSSDYGSSSSSDSGFSGGGGSFDGGGSSGSW